MHACRNVTGSAKKDPLSLQVTLHVFTQQLITYLVNILTLSPVPQMLLKSKHSSQVRAQIITLIILSILKSNSAADHFISSCYFNSTLPSTLSIKKPEGPRG